MGVGFWLKLLVAAEQCGKGQDGWYSDPPPTPSTNPASRRPERWGPVSPDLSASRVPVTNFPGMHGLGIQARHCGFLFENASLEDKI